MGGAIQLMAAEVTEPPDGGATDDDLVSLATQGNRAGIRKPCCGVTTTSCTALRGA